MTRKRTGPHHQRKGRADPTTPRARRPSGVARERVGRLVLAGILGIVAVFLRLHGLAYRDLWFDELGSVAMATTGDLWVSEGGNPPLFFALLRGWIRTAGTDVASVRALSALAGAGAVAALFWVAVELKLPTPVRWWGAVLLACSPLHLYYSQEARAYALLVLLLLLALGSFLRALETGFRRWWVAHWACLVAGLYTHNMMIPMVGAFWVTALVLRAPAARWKGLAIAHALVALAYVPWVPRLWQQAGSESHYWISDLVRGVSVPELVAGTFEAFNIGGRLPSHLAFPASPGTPVWSVLFFGTACLMAILAERRAARRSGSEVVRKSIGVLVVFAAWPTLFLVASSWLSRPLYVVGRYDLPAEPAYLLLVALGLHELAVRLRAFGRAVSMVPACALLILTLFALAPKLALANDGADQQASYQIATALKAWATPTDLVIGLDYSGPLASYGVLRAGIPLQTEQFPHERLDQLDEASLGRRVASNMAVFREEAITLAARALGRRIWLVESPIYGDLLTPRHGYEVLKVLLLSELRHHRPPPAEVQAALRDMSIVRLDPQ